MKLSYLHVATAIILGTAANAQTSGHVGPTTPLSEKQGTICNVLNYGGSIGSNVRSLVSFISYDLCLTLFIMKDIGPAINSAFNNCVLKASNGATLYVPEGNYNMQTWVTLNGGNKWAFRMDGVITRTSRLDSFYSQ